jgi:isoquinoline 1-oxidoreductase subunit beta
MRRSTFRPAVSEPLLTRRGLLTGALVGGALVVGWVAWPRAYEPNLSAAPGETIFNGYLKIGADGHVTVVSPQVEMGQGSYTIIAQIVADELGADWRTLAIEPAAINPLYANELASVSWKQGLWPTPKLQVTGDAMTQRAFEAQLRQAAAGTRMLLCKAAADQWGVDWEACNTEAGYVTWGKKRTRFGELAAGAAKFDLPPDIQLRVSGTRIAGRGMSRLDVPAKLDGSATYAADIRLPDMVFAAIRQGPPGNSSLKSFDRRAASTVQGVVSVIDHANWIAVAANSWWAANLALDRLAPRFVTPRGLIEQDEIDKRLTKALKDGGKVFDAAGDVDALFEGIKPFTQTYSAGFAQHGALEPMAATASIDGETLQLWIATQVPSLARAAAARAIGMDEDAVTIHPTQLGGSFGRKYEIEIAAQAALIARKVGRPVQLIWSRAEDAAQDRMRPAAKAILSARLGGAGRIDAWRAAIATGNAIPEMISRSLDQKRPHEALDAHSGSADKRAVSGAVPPYAIPAYEVRHHPVDIGVPSGKLRAGADGYTCFFTESFVDELAQESGRDPFSFRMGLLTGNTRMAKCLSKVAIRGGWDGGGQGTSQGLACHMMGNSFIAVLAEAQMGDDGHVRVAKLTAVADAGRIMNPDIARQQIEGGLLYGMALATAAAVRMERGLPEPRRLGLLGLPRLATMPEVSVELIVSTEAAGGLGELAVPAVAPAIANALFAGSGQRLRSLPLGQVV